MPFRTDVSVAAVSVSCSCARWDNFPMLSISYGLHQAGVKSLLEGIYMFCPQICRLPRFGQECRSRRTMPTFFEVMDPRDGRIWVRCKELIHVTAVRIFLREHYTKFSYRKDQLRDERCQKRPNHAECTSDRAQL